MATELTPGGYGKTKQDTPPAVEHERELANRMAGPSIGANVNVTVVTPAGHP